MKPLNSLTRTILWPLTLLIALSGGTWIQWLVLRQHFRNVLRSPDPGLPPGVTSKDIDGPELPLCDTCGEEFNPDGDEEICPACAEELDSEEEE